MKRILVLMLCAIMMMGMVGCGKSDSTTTDTTQTDAATTTATGDSATTDTTATAEPVTLTMLIHDDVQYQYITETKSISDAFKEVMPNVTIEVEKAKDSEELESTLKIRNSATELPDIMQLKPYMLASFADVLAPLGDTDAAKNNLYAEQYAVDGNVVGIPESVFYEFVYYRKSVFQEYGLKIPQTWDEFIATAQTIKEKGTYIPILMGGKDSWPDYPFNEYMPCLEAGKGDLWNIMATQDEPFTKGEPFYNAYEKIQKLYDAQVFGKDPLGIGFDQARSMFIAKEGAMIAAGQWFASDFQGNKGDMSDLGLFLLPTRNTNSDPFYATVMADGFFATPKEGENTETVKAFFNWYLTSDYMKEYLKVKGVNSTMKDIVIDLPIFNEALNAVDAQYIVYDGGNIDFQNIVNSFGFDVKKLGQEMMASNKFEEMMADLNKQWKEGRGN